MQAVSLEGTLDPRTPVVMGNQRRPPALKALTSLRFFAALQVALYHYVRPYSKFGIFAPANGAGYSGISFFFLLSGFILTYTHAPEYEGADPSPSTFYIARFARIYPLCALSLLCSALLHPEYLHSTIRFFALAANFLLLQAWTGHLRGLFNPVTWTLSVEAFFYLIFPYAVRRLQPATRKRAWLALGGMWLLAMVAPLVMMYIYPTAGWHEDSSRASGHDMVEAVGCTPLFQAPEFLAGILLGWIYLRFRPSTRIAPVLAGVGVIVLATALFMAGHLPFIALHNGLLIPCYALIILGFAEPHWMSRMMSIAPLVLLGEASYALYLFHVLFNDFAMKHGAPGTIFAAIWKLTVISVISILLHLSIERPARKRILRWWKLRRERKLQPAL